MTTPTNFSETGITAYAEPPLISTGAKYQIALSTLIGSYSHTVSASGGYKSARVGLILSQGDIEEWLENGLGRHIVAYNEGGQVIWEGFVNDMEATIGGLSVKRGPLMGIANRVRIVYSTVDTSVVPPAVGVRKKLAYANDTASQAKYGILEKVLSVGGATAANAAYIRDTFIADNAEAETTPTQIVLGGTGGLSLALNCLGYISWLNAYTYNSTTTGATTLSARIQAVLTADPNTIISTDYGRITANTLSVPAYEQDDPLALAYVNGLVVLGDAAYNRYTFGIYADQQAYYTVMPSAEEYIWRIADGGEVYTPLNAMVRPWDVRPARWVHIPDFMIGRISDATAMRDDPRMMFIESLTFSAPYSLTLTGAKISKLPQVLGQLGLAGIGA